MITIVVHNSQFKIMITAISCGLSLQATSKPRVKALIKKFNVQILKFKVFNAPWRCGNYSAIIDI